MPTAKSTVATVGAASGNVQNMNPLRHQIMPPSFLAPYQPDYVILMNPIYVAEVQRDLDRMGAMAKILAVGA